MKNGRAYIPLLVIFVGYLRGLSSAGNKNICRYLPLFAKHKKRYHQAFVLFCGLME